MPILNDQDFCAHLRPNDRVMALDVGSKTIGLATAVWGTELVMPLRTLARVKFTKDATALVQVMVEMGVAGLVVGWPLLPDGRMGKRCQSVRDFTTELNIFLQNKYPITFWDERFSTARGDEIVDNIGKTAGKSVKNRRDDIIDSLAAQQILLDFLDYNPV